MIAVMLKEKTVFILGAGSSRDYGYPTGPGLMELMRDRCEEVKKGTASFAGNSGFTNDQFLDFGKLLDDNNTIFPSIDALLYTHPEHIELGRFLIATCLLPCEKADDFSKIEDEKNWMLYLFRKMEGGTLDDFADNPVKFISFNYDRCLDYYLRKYLIARYRATAQKVDTALQAIPIIHVHGWLGPFNDLV